MRLAQLDSLQGGSLEQLATLTAVILAVFFAWRWWRQRQLMRARADLPLVLGGWGTRGKSGTERCKAALFHAYGAEILAKTTGNEATVVYGLPGDEAVEIPLFRPYDKASIWEMADTLELAAAMQVDVFLYECMALQPRYVRVIQDAWMRDDFSTLTNAHPDHEDVQGPSGRDVARSIASFLPRDSQAWTCEEQMTPVLTAMAAERGTELHQVSWLDAALLADDIIARLPYREHRSNLALVRALGTHMGFEEDFILKEVADNLVPDLGVLRTYGPLTAAGRWLEFSNGMSANEARAAWENWQRLGLQEREQVGEWLVPIVNNRADRVPRSRVFSWLLVSRLRWDCVVLIGTNLPGLRGYLLHDLAQYWADVELPPADGLRSRLAQDLREHRFGCGQAVGLREALFRVLLGAGLTPAALHGLNACLEPVFRDAERVSGAPGERERAGLEQAWQTHVAALQQPLRELWPGALTEPFAEESVQLDEALSFCGHFWQQRRAVASLQARLDQGGDADALSRLYREFFVDQLAGRIVSLDDPGASGDQVVHTVLHRVPPGYHAQLVGMQNIKGTGLDFAHLWVQLQAVQRDGQRLAELEAATRQGALLRLAGTAGGFFVQRQILSELQSSPPPRDATETQLRDGLLRSCEQRLRRSASRLVTSKRSPPLLQLLATALDTLTDVFLGLYRRWRVQRVLRALRRGWIAPRTATLRIGALVKEEKAGWLGRRRDERAGATKASSVHAAGSLPRLFVPQSFDDQRAGLPGLQGETG